MTLEHFVNLQTCAEMLKTQRAQHIATVSTHGGFAPFMRVDFRKHRASVCRVRIDLGKHFGG